PSKRRSLIDWATNTFHFEHQVDELIAETPDLVLLWIGHNNLDWVATRLGGDIERTAEDFSSSYEVQLRRLIRMATLSSSPKTIIVFGLVNFRAFFLAREEAEQQHASDPQRFPFLQRAYLHFASMQPTHRGTMIDLAESCNSRLEELCIRLNRNVPGTVR